MHTGSEVRAKWSATGVVEVGNLAGLAVLEDLEMQAIYIGRSTTVTEGVWVESGVVLGPRSISGGNSDGSVFDGVDRRKHESDGTEGEHGGGRHCGVSVMVVELRK